jgi:putative transposase
MVPRWEIRLGPTSWTPGWRPGSGEPEVSEHRSYQLYAHITWHTWKRVSCVNRLAAIDVKSAVASACRETGVHVLGDAVLTDHVHLVVSFRPNTRLCDFVRLAKGRSATSANRRIVGAVRWARGYYVATLHRNDLARVKRYVATQFEHHADRIPKDPPGYAC